MITLEELDKIIANFIQNEEFMSFEEIALLIHSFQFQNNTFYRQYCFMEGVGKTIESLDNIPSIEIESFKGDLIPSVDNISSYEGMYIETSGTINGKKTRIYRDAGYFKLRSLTIQKQGVENWFRRYNSRVKIICLDKANRRNQNGFKEEYSVLNNIISFFGSKDSVFYDHNCDYPKIIQDVLNAALKHIPLVIIGPSYYLSDIVVRMKSECITIPYNSQLLIMDSGGLKNKSTHHSYDQYKEDLFDAFSLQCNNYKNTYAMTEIGTQISDGESGEKIVPRWARIKLVDENGKDNKSFGKIVALDLLNRANLFCIKTKDIAYYNNTNLIIKGKEL